MIPKILKTTNGYLIKFLLKEMFTCFECPRVASEYDYYRCYLIICLYQTKKGLWGILFHFQV